MRAMLGPEVYEVKRRHLQRFCFLSEMSSEYVRDSRPKKHQDYAVHCPAGTPCVSRFLRYCDPWYLDRTRHLLYFHHLEITPARLAKCSMR